MKVKRYPINYFEPISKKDFLNGIPCEMMGMGWVSETIIKS